MFPSSGSVRQQHWDIPLRNDASCSSPGWFKWPSTLPNEQHNARILLAGCSMIKAFVGKWTHLQTAKRSLSVWGKFQYQFTHRGAIVTICKLKFYFPSQTTAIKSRHVIHRQLCILIIFQSDSLSCFFCHNSFQFGALECSQNVHLFVTVSRPPKKQTQLRWAIHQAVLSRSKLVIGT